MAGSRKPVATIIAAVLSLLVTGGALVAAATLREPASPPAQTPTTTPTDEIGPDGCLGDRCAVVASAPIGNTIVQLVADEGARSGRLRIGGAGSSNLFEVTVTELGVTLNEDSLQCVPAALSACLVRGPFDGGVAGQVVVGRSAKWNQLDRPFVSTAGYLVLAEVASEVGPEVVAVQYDCDSTATPDCADERLFAQAFSLTGMELGCTRTYSRIESLPGYPTVDFASSDLRPCA